MHIAHTFMLTPGTRQQRVDIALEEMGTPVVHGAFSTFLAVLVLSVSKSYIFRVFFRQFFGIVVFGPRRAGGARTRGARHRSDAAPDARLTCARALPVDAGASHGLILLPVLLSLVGPSYINAGKADPHAKPHDIEAKAVHTTSSTLSVDRTPASAPPSPPGSSHGRPEAAAALQHHHPGSAVRRPAQVAPSGKPRVV